MTEAERITLVQNYLNEILAQYESGHAREHSYRPALERLMMGFEKVHAVNEPKHSEHGAPDFVFLSDNNNDLILGYAEAKDIGVSLDKTEKTEQMARYGGYANLFLTDYLEFRFFRNGEKYEIISLGSIKDEQLNFTPENGERLIRELEAFIQQPPERIRSGKRLAQIMGGKARRIRENVKVYLTQDNERSNELVKIFKMMKKMLVHDLTEEKFADMYAQTLVYGLFVARYGDKTPDTFSRSEARDLVPKSNPFLRHFFDHIVGPDFDSRLGYIVDELCEVFLASNVNDIVHKHLRIVEDSAEAKDPIIHFYEDFLQEYDPAERKKMGAYYTPIPVVRFIVQSVDRILKDDFGVEKGLASDEFIEYEVDTGQDLRVDRRTRINTKQTLHLPRVQVLDPAVGTATFLNETIKFIYKTFQGQEGRWPSYVNENLLKRLYGFELMMAPYTIAHLKLGMTLKETGADSLRERLSVYLTNTLEEGIPQQSSLFDFGLAGAVSEESRLAAEVKSERPVMVVMGNPPYSVSSNNKSKWIQSLIADYKTDLNERKINLDDDYIKFIRFAEDMVCRNGSGIVSMITNNSYLDGVTHRVMRHHLMKSFNKIYILDLHGSAKRGDRAEDGGKDENVFDIMQGVSIVLMVKTNDSTEKLANVYFSELYGRRKEKFQKLNQGDLDFTNIESAQPNYYFTPRKQANSKYDNYIKVSELMPTYVSGIQTKNDNLAIKFSQDDIESVVSDFESMDKDSLRNKYSITDSSGWNLDSAINSVKKLSGEYRDIDFRPFDRRKTYYTRDSGGFIGRPRTQVMQHMLHKNIGLLFPRQAITGRFGYFVTNTICDINFTGTAGQFGAGLLFPLYIYHNDGSRTVNFEAKELARLVANLSAMPKAEEIIDYIYAILHSRYFRDIHKESLQSDFPRIPIPTQADFDRLITHGRQLRDLHLMDYAALNEYETTFPVSGDDVVGKINFVDDKVWINDTQYFGNVSETAWNFYIGGYQPAQKWLKDRKGRVLTGQDLDHYQKIIKALLETDRIMHEIDAK